MMKGSDAVMLAVCNAFNLETQVRPRYIPEESVDDEDEESDGEENENKEERVHARRGLDPVTLFGMESSSTAQRDLGPNTDWIGDKFRHTIADENMGDPEGWLSDRLQGESWVKRYRGIHWLNDYNHIETYRAYTTVYPVFLHTTECKVWQQPRYRDVVLCRGAFCSYS